MSSRPTELTEQLYNYFQDISLRENAVMRQCRRETQKLDMGKMQITPEQAQFMGFLVELSGARRALEVGTFTGYSALAVAQAMPADGYMLCCDVDEQWTSMAQRFWQQAGVAHKIELRLAPAMETLDNLIADGQNNTFDFVFIDADKANYPRYYARCLQLVRRGGVIAIDNIFRGGKVADLTIETNSVNVSRQMNEILKHDERVSLTVLPLGDGLALARKR